MKAALYDHYGPGELVSWRDVPAPHPGPREVLIRVEAAALNPKDIMLRKGKYRVLSGRHFPKQLGLDLVGRVVDLGSLAPSPLLGARVFGFFTGFRARHGSLAQLTPIACDAIAPIPPGIDSVSAAAVPLAGSTALQALRDDARLVAGERALIIGASGGVGTFAVQVAKLLGAHVAGSTSARNAQLVRELGADEVFDHTSALPFGRGPYDVVLDCFGRTRAAQLAGVLGKRGRFVSLVPSIGLARDIALGRVFGPRTRLTSVEPRRSDLAQLAAWLREGRLRPIVERVYAMDELHAAMQHLETRHARGKLVIRVEPAT